jgi:hypothetical protein
MSASAKIADVRSLLKGEPVFLAGSLVAEQAYGMSNAHSDVDLFCPNEHVLVATGQKLLCNGYTFDDRFERVWVRWLRYGFKTWHTNSLRLLSPTGVETNLVYKIVDGHKTTSLAQVLESFDFGLLGMGWDLEADMYRDLRPYLFPGEDINGPLPMMPSRRINWRNGFISRYNGLREYGRYAKYHNYGYDMSRVKDDLVEGYWGAALYFNNGFKQEQKDLGKIYELIAEHIQHDNIDELVQAAKEIDFNDSLDVIMEALE